MTTARQFLDLLHAYEQFKVAGDEPERLMREMPEAQFRLVVQATAVLFSQLKQEAIRRGIWDELKTWKPPTGEAP
jgi:DNA polymerase III gamma/tau subunit